MLRKALLSFTLFIWAFSASAGTVVLHGNNPEYANLTLTFKQFGNQISDTEETIAETKVQPNGDFELKFEIDQTTYIFSHLGVFFMYLYVEPGTEYNIKLPKRVDKKSEDILNPFFEELMLQLVVPEYKVLGQSEKGKVTEGLNFLINSFDNTFNPLYTKYSVAIMSRKKPEALDSTLKNLDKIFGNSGNSYFRDYYTYRIGMLKFTSSKFKSRNISDNYFLNKPVLYNNPAYMTLFNKVYEKYFVYFGMTESGKTIYNDINTSKSLTCLKETLAQDKVLANDTLKEFVILKALHDGCSEMEFSRSGMLQILDSLIISSKISYHRKIASQIRDKVSKLITGFAPPPFQLLNQDSVLVSLDSFKESYVYLAFVTTQNYACLKDFDLLKRIQDKYGKLVKIVAISADESLSAVRHFTQNYKQYNWPFLHYANQPDIIKDYDLRVFPTYFLIDREGKLVMSPAPGPSENFEIRFFEHLRARRLL
jgi:hypothetical protein